MNVTHDVVRMAPPTDELRNGCGPHTSSPPNNPEVDSPPYASAAGIYHNNNAHHQNYYRQQQQYNEGLFDAVMEMFNKRFFYQKMGNCTWNLPAADVLFSEYYRLDSLQQLKVRLNDVKSKLNDYVIEAWSIHTKRKEPAGEIPWRLKSETKAEFVTIAWCKLFECLSKFPLLVKGPRMNSLHLCEAPGAFIAALNHYLYSKYDKNDIQWNWLATTLNPYYEGNHVMKMIMDDRFILYTQDNWLFHKDFTGNIIDNDNVEHMKQQCQLRLGDVHLITADGSIDCIDAPDCQEEKVAVLHFAEILTALEILAEGGSFVIKMFTLFEASSVSKMYLLNCAFREVCVFKPCTSKRGNSEVYVICLDYQKDNKELKLILEKMREKLNGDNKVMWPLFPKSCFPNDFLMQHEIMCRLFMSYQTEAIESNIYSFEIKPNKAAIKRLQALRKLVCDEYYKRYKVRKISEKCKILYQYHANIEKSYMTQIYHGSHSEREMLKETTKEQQIFTLRKQLNNLGKMLTDLQAIDQLQCNFKRCESQDTLKLTPYRGKTYDTLHSTLFANIHLFVMRSKLNNFHTSDVLWHNNPHIAFPQNNFVINFNDFVSSSSSKFSQQQELFFKSFVENLLKYKPAVIKFMNMPFLTHYAASILRYLSLFSYEQLTFTFHPTFEIVLEKMSPDFNKALNELNVVLLGSSSDQDRILCFINILELHHNDFNTTLTSFNNMLLLQNFKSILDN